MEKPINLKAKETEEQIVNIINEAGLPAFITKTIVEKIYKQLEIIEQKQLEFSQKEYQESLQKEKKAGGKSGNK